MVGRRSAEDPGAGDEVVRGLEELGEWMIDAKEWSGGGGILLASSVFPHVIVCSSLGGGGGGGGACFIVSPPHDPRPQQREPQPRLLLLLMPLPIQPPQVGTASSNLLRLAFQLSFAASADTASAAKRAMSLDLPERGVEHAEDHCHVPPCPRFWFPGP